MNYIEVYKKRVGHLGDTPQDRAFNSGILEFRRYLKYNSHTEHNLSLDKQDETFSGVILTDKEDENRVSQILLVKLVEDGGPAIKQGDLLWWGEDKQPWLIYRSTTSSYQPHQKFYMVRCNYEVNWLDDEGMLHSSWIYLLGSKDSKIKDNFRTWHSVITPQPNKYINIMLPHQLMPLGTEIMVMDEVWTLVDYDQNSVPGVIYMSFTETNFNEQRDSLEDKLANADKLANWSINMPDNCAVTVGEEFELIYTVLKNGVSQTITPEIILSDNLVLTENGKIKAIASGTGNITLTYKDITKTQTITIGDISQAELIFIGDEIIRVGSENTYRLENAAPEKTHFICTDLNDLELGNNELFTFKKIESSLIIKVNDKNKLGRFKIKVFYENEMFYEKIISIVPLWQVI